MKIDFIGQKMAIEFDKVPKFLYFNENGIGCGAVFINGQRQKGLMEVSAYAKTNDEEKHPLHYLITTLDEETHTPKTIGNAKSKEFLSVDVKIMDLKPFKIMLETMKQYSIDARISEEIRKEFIDKVLNITEEIK